MKNTNKTNKGIKKIVAAAFAAMMLMAAAAVSVSAMNSKPIEEGKAAAQTVTETAAETKTENKDKPVFEDKLTEERPYVNGFHLAPVDIKDI